MSLRFYETTVTVLSKHTRSIWCVAETSPLVKSIQSPRYSNTTQQTRNPV